LSYEKGRFFRAGFSHISLDKGISQKVSSPRYGRSDNLSGQENVLQPEGFDLLPVFRFLCKVHLAEQKQIVGQHHYLKDRFISPK
jgi:hypothetical protein